MFVFPLDPKDLFAERALQMNQWGIPAPIVKRMRTTIRDSWADGPGGWTYEWSKEADLAVGQKKWRLASALFGAARFPLACTESRVAALARQVECYLEASRTFPCAFERVVLTMQSSGDTMRVPVHVFAPKGRGTREDIPLVLLSGGVDTYKMELHRLALLLCKLGAFRVAAIDMPGTGETKGVLSAQSHEIYEGVLDALAPRTRVRRAVLGISFGGHWAAKLAMRETVDCAIDIGGPVGYLPLDKNFLTNLPNGMTGIVANAMGFRALPTPDEAAHMLEVFSLREQLERKRSAPLIALNGAGDPYIPQGETKVFGTMPNGRGWIFRDGDHCAANQLPRIVPYLIAWLRTMLHGNTAWNRTLEGVATYALPARLAS